MNRREFLKRLLAIPVIVLGIDKVIGKPQELQMGGMFVGKIPLIHEPVTTATDGYIKFADGSIIEINPVNTPVRGSSIGVWNTSDYEFLVSEYALTDRQIDDIYQQNRDVATFNGA